MSSAAGTDTSIEAPEVGTIDMGLEVVTLPVSDVDRAKQFYESLGWRVDADIVAGDRRRKRATSQLQAHAMVPTSALKSRCPCQRRC